MPNVILRVRNLKTNFYTYAGVVQALEGVSFDLNEGDTLGLVGETGCGKSVTALSILRLIPQPPGKIEEGEILFDVPADVATRMEALEASVYGMLPRIFGEGPGAHPDDLSIRRLNGLWDRAKTRGIPKADLEAFRGSAHALVQLKTPYDLLVRSDLEMRTIRGNRIAMIFQDPMQSLNPVFTIGDQIGENILLHQRAAVVKGLLEKMDVESERDRLASELHKKDPTATASSRPLPQAAPIPSPVALTSAVWIGASLAYFVLFGILGTILGFFGVGFFAGFFGLLAGLALLQVVPALGLLWLRPWARSLGVPLVVLDALGRAIAIGGFGIVGWLLYAVWGVVADVFVWYQLSKPEVAEALTGRVSGWDAALHGAEADVGALVDLSDVVAKSRLQGREQVVEQLDALIARIRAAFDPRERVSGHFHPLLPRRVQLALLRRMAAKPEDRLIRVLAAIPLVGRAVRKPVEREAIERAILILRKVKISDPERIAQQYPYELSGGMQQRALISIALSCNPRLLIADEPTTALDVTIQAQILDLIREMKSAFGSSVLIITHDLGIIAEMCNRVCVMYAGHIVEDAASRAVFKAPLHPYTQGLMRAIPSHTVRKDRLEIIRGSVPNLIYPPPGCRFHPRCPQVMPTCGWSAKEAGEDLLEVLRESPPTGGGTLALEETAWVPASATELHVAFPAGTSPSEAVEVLRSAVSRGRSRPAIAAITSVEPAAAAKEGEPAYHAVIRVLDPRKPPAYLPERNHAVACFLYEESPTIAGGVPAGR